MTAGRSARAGTRRPLSALKSFEAAVFADAAEPLTPETAHAAEPTVIRDLLNDLNRRTDFHPRIDLRRNIRRHTDTPVRSRVTGKHSDMHAYSFPSQSHEKKHWRPDKMAAAWRRVDSRADSATDDPALRIDIISEDI